MKAIILCAGEGTRMRPLTYSRPKHLLPIANRPVIEWILAALASAGITDIAVVVSPTTRAAFHAALGDGAELGLRLSYIVQDEPKGLAHAVACAEGYVAGEPFLLYLGDNLFEAGIRGLVEVFHGEDCSAAISLVRVEDPRRFGVARLEDGRIVQLVEKPEHPLSDLAVAGAYVFAPSIFDAIRRIQPSARCELEITDAIQRLVEDDRAVLPHGVEGWWKDVGRPRDMITANALLVAQLEPSMEGRIDGSSEVRGHVAIGPDATVGASTIEGPAVIGAGAQVRNAVIGPNVAVGDGCILEDCRIEHSILMDGASVRGLEHVGWSILGRDTEVTKGGSSSENVLLLGDDSSLQLK